MCACRRGGTLQVLKAQVRKNCPYDNLWFDVKGKGWRHVGECVPCYSKGTC
jgi:hypothetical protein